MHVEIEQFGKWLRSPTTGKPTHHYPPALHRPLRVRLFFAWAGKSPAEITVRDVDDYIAHTQEQRHAIATINQRLVEHRPC